MSNGHYQNNKETFRKRLKQRPIEYKQKLCNAKKIKVRQHFSQVNI